MKKGNIALEINAGVIEGPRGLSISSVELKETLENGNNVYNVFIENGQKIGEFIANKGDVGEKGDKGDTGKGIVSVSKKRKVDLMTYYEILYTDNSTSEFAVEDGQNAYELWIGNGNEGDIEDFFEAYRGYGLDFVWQGTKLGVKKINENTYTFVDLLGKTGPNGKNLEFQWNGTSLGIRVEGEENYQFIDLRGEKGKNLEFQWRGTELGVKVEGDSQYQYVDLVGQGSSYDLPIATKTTLGGIKIGENMKITPEGVLNPKYPIASGSSRGVVQIGDGISVDSKGIISIKGIKIGGDIAIGSFALFNDTTGSDNVAIGTFALTDNTTGSGNVAIGNFALSRNTTGSGNIGIGSNTDNRGYNDSVCLGSFASVTGSSQIQLGSSGTSVYCYGAVQNRSDERDKADIKDTSLGLEFLTKLRPREYRWDYRESYINTEEIGKISNKIKKMNKKGRKIDINSALERFSIENVKKDGSQKGRRFHQGFVAQEVFQVMRELGVDFGGYQDHSINGGKDVLSIGYNEFIPVLVKGIQEQQKHIEQLKSKIEKLEGKINV